MKHFVYLHLQQEVTYTLYLVFTIPIQLSILLLHVSVCINTSVVCFQHLNAVTLYIPLLNLLLSRIIWYLSRLIVNFNCIVFAFTCIYSFLYWWVFWLFQIFQLQIISQYFCTSPCARMVSIRHISRGGAGGSRNMSSPILFIILPKCFPKWLN